MYKWVLANLILGLGVMLQWTGIPSRVVKKLNIRSHFMQQKLKISTGLMGHLARMQTTKLQLLQDLHKLVKKQ